MNKYKWQIENRVVLEKDTNASFNINVESEYSERFKQYIDNGGLVDPAKSIVDLYNDLYDKVTSKTAELVNGNGFIYEDVPFYTDSMAQQNFTALLIMKDNLSYPYLIWDGNRSIEISDASEMIQFCGLMFTYIANIRTNGKAIRDTLSIQDGESDNDYRVRLENFVDPRD